IEDIEIALYTLAWEFDFEEIEFDGFRISLILERFGALPEASPDVPFEQRERVRRMIRGYARAPLSYSSTAAERVAHLVSAAEFDLLTTGAELASSEESQVIRTRHFLPACERWPFPLNR